VLLIGAHQTQHGVTGDEGSGDGVIAGAFVAAVITEVPHRLNEVHQHQDQHNDQEYHQNYLDNRVGVRHFQ